MKIFRSWEYGTVSLSFTVWGYGTVPADTSFLKYSLFIEIVVVGFDVFLRLLVLKRYLENTFLAKMSKPVLGYWKIRGVNLL